MKTAVNFCEINYVMIIFLLIENLQNKNKTINFMTEKKLRIIYKKTALKNELGP